MYIQYMNVKKVNPEVTCEDRDEWTEKAHCADLT